MSTIYIVYGQEMNDCDPTSWWLVKAFKNKDESIKFEHELNTRRSDAIEEFAKLRIWASEQATKRMGKVPWMKWIYSEERKDLNREIQVMGDDIVAKVGDPYFQPNADDYKTMELELV